jgi:preprotein translocase SecE subunit
MEHSETTAVAPDKARRGPAGGSSEGRVPRPRRKEGGLLTQYKPEQGKFTRAGTFIGLGLLVAWGAWFVFDQLRVYEDIEAWWGLLITRGIPILFAVTVGMVAWRVAFANRKTSDFMIATEGEMKKVSWSKKGEVIGSTKVVILFTFLLALLLFVVDLVFQHIFSSIGVLKL